MSFDNDKDGNTYRRRSYLGATGAALAAGLAGCINMGGGGGQGDGGDGQSKTQITYHDRYEWVKDYPTAYNEGQDEIHVEASVDPTTSSGAYQGVIAEISAGNAPETIGLDVVQIAKFADLGALQELGTFAEDLDYFDDIFEPLQRNFVTYDGNSLGLPFWIDLSMYYYNKRHFEEAGLDPENPPTTYEEYLAANEAVGETVGTGTASSFGGFFYFPTAWSNGAQLFNDDGSECVIDSQAGVEALEFWVELNQSEYTTDLVSTEWQTAHDLFVDEKAAMVHSGGYALGYTRDKNPDLIENGDLGVTMLPKPSADASRTSFLGGNAITITKQAAQNDEKFAAAKAFTEWVNSEAGMEVTLDNGYFPARKAGFDLPVAQENEALFAPFQTALSQGHAPPMHPDYREASTTLFSATEPALNGDTSAADALSSAVERINSTIL